MDARRPHNARPYGDDPRFEALAARARRGGFLHPAAAKAAAGGGTGAAAGDGRADLGELTGPVGMTPFGNEPEDVRTVAGLLAGAVGPFGLGYAERDAVERAAAGPASVGPSAAGSALGPAIAEFQRRTFNGWYDGVVTPGGATLRELIRAAAGPASRPEIGPRR